MGRVDLHKPSTAEYGDYSFLCGFFQGTCGSEEYADYLSTLFESDIYHHEDALEKHPTFQGNWAKKESCDHCGARFKYGVCYLHKPSGELVHVGHTCASKAFSYSSRIAVTKKNMARKAAIARKAAKVLDANPGLYEALQIGDNRVKEARKDLRVWGNLKEGRIKLVLKIAAERKELEEGGAIPVPTFEGRVVVKATILGFKTKRGHYGTTLKMLVQTEDGYKLFGSLPAQLEGAEDSGKGAVVQFSAKVEPSGDDPYFGFFSRPTKASVLVAAPVIVEAPVAEEPPAPKLSASELAKKQSDHAKVEEAYEAAPESVRVVLEPYLKKLREEIEGAA
jgi:hypothetical protein